MLIVRLDREFENKIYDGNSAMYRVKIYYCMKDNIKL